MKKATCMLLFIIQFFEEELVAETGFEPVTFGL